MRKCARSMVRTVTDPAPSHRALQIPCACPLLPPPDRCESLAPHQTSVRHAPECAPIAPAVHRRSPYSLRFAGHSTASPITCAPPTRRVLLPLPRPIPIASSLALCLLLATGNIGPVWPHRFRAAHRKPADSIRWFHTHLPALLPPRGSIAVTALSSYLQSSV